nr:glucan endo-1,3-beta-D-glucosidase [uncultured Psychroserpens sp.]
MKHLKYLIVLSFLMASFFACQDEDQEFGDIIAPTNIQIEIDKVGADADNPNGDGSGTVNFTATADNAITFHFVIQNQTKLADGGSVSHDFTLLGDNSYTVTVIAFGTGGISTSKSVVVDVLSLYEPPADLLEMLHGSGSRVWRIKSEVDNHFGLGPVGGDNPFSFFGAPAESKAGVGMYDDRYVFNADGTFTHITDSTNDDPTEDTSGTVFGREVLIDELGGSGGEADGADILNLIYSDYSEQWSLSAPGGVETISLSGLAFMGYYIGGDHKYIIVSRSANEMTVKSTDGNGEFDWGFVLTAE